jgi:hypothetical protein
VESLPPYYVPTVIFHAFLYSNGTMEDLNNLTSLPAGLTLWEATAINNSGQVVGEASNGDAFLLTPLEPGDANGDGRVDINDLTIVLSNFGQTGMTWSQGNFTGDPTVDINDLTILLSNYGYGVTAAAGVKGVPEPAALVLLLAALACLLASRPGLQSRAVALGNMSSAAAART